MVVYDSTLITPTTGLMIWTLVTFVVVLIVLKKYAFGPIQQMIDQRRVAITADLDSAEKAREEAQSCPRRVPPAARGGPQGGVPDRRGRPPGRRGAPRGRRRRARGRDGPPQGAGQGGDRRRDPPVARRDQAARGRAHDRRDREGRPRASSTRREQKRLIDDALADVDFAALVPEGERVVAERIEPAARVYADALYAAARDAGRTREVDADLKALTRGAGREPSAASRRLPTPRSRATPRSG